MAMPPETAATRIGLSSSKSSTSAEKLLAFENGEAIPTQKQLVKIGDVYHRPLIYFYLDKRPRKDEGIVDFRVPIGKTSVEENAILSCLVRDMIARQGIIKALLEDDPEIASLRFVGNSRQDAGISATVSSILKILYPQDDKKTSSELSKDDRKFSNLRKKVEDASVFVVLAGNLGSHHSNIDVSVFRGFALVDSFAPFIIINEHDVEGAMAFTLIHELVHICIGASGISGSPLNHEFNSSTEKFCNDVAGAFLFPTNALRDVHVIRTTSDARSIVSEKARYAGVSESLVAYRMFRASLINQRVYNDLSMEYRERWLQRRDSQRRLRKDRHGTSSFKTVRRHRLGTNLLQTVKRLHQTNDLTDTKAATVLGVKPLSVDKILVEH